MLSLVVIRLQERPSGPHWTYGMRRAEVLSGQANSAVLLVLSALVTYEAIARLIHPPQVAGSIVTIVAALGVIVNLAAVWVWRKPIGRASMLKADFSIFSPTSMPSSAPSLPVSSFSRRASTRPTPSRRLWQC